MAYFKKGDIVRLQDKTVVMILELIGSGQQGDVYKAYDRVRKCYVAVKHCYGSYVNNKDKFYEKVKIMADHRPPDDRLCWPTGVSQLTGDKCFLYVMPLLEGYRPFTGLVTNKDSVTMEQKVKILNQAAQVIQNLHKQSLIYGDISDKNLLYRVEADGSVDVRFIDCDNITLPGFSLGVQGTGKYRAPELLLPDPDRSDGRPQCPSQKSDDFGFSVLAFRVLMRRHPLDGTLARTKRADDYEGFLEYYGRNPRFIFDGQSNAPSDNIVRKWRALPEPMKIFFRCAFRQEALKDKHARPDMAAFLRCLSLAYKFI